MNQNSEQPHQFTLKARNGNEEWTTVKEFSNLEWTNERGETKTLYFYNNKAYHEYRLENICSNYPTWKLNSVDLRSYNVPFTIPDFDYGVESITLYKYERMEELHPNSDYYYDFSSDPSLPNGISIDLNTGIISGTPLEPSKWYFDRS